MAEVWATVATVAAAAVGIAGTAYAATNQPGVTSASASSRQAAEAAASALPYQRGLAAAEQQGGSALRIGYTQSTNGAQLQASLNKQLSKLQAQLAKESGDNGRPGRATRIQGQIDDLKAQLASVPTDGSPVYLNKKGKPVSASEALADFKGYGTADIEGKLARRMADMQIELGKKYGTDFAKQATAEARLSDPLGFAARDRQYEMLQDEEKNPLPINPLSGTLQNQIDAQVKAGSGLDSMSRDVLDAAVARAQADRNGMGPSADSVAGNMSTGMEGAARREAGITKGQQFIGSGATPADIEYRRTQQMLADQGAFVNGQSPEAQFQSLSGASQGATPFVPGQSLPSTANTSGAPAYGLAAWQAQLKQPNSWMAGVSTALNSLSAASKATG